MRLIAYIWGQKTQAKIKASGDWRPEWELIAHNADNAPDA
jgi:hypothetical protein